MLFHWSIPPEIIRYSLVTGSVPIRLGMDAGAESRKKNAEAGMRYRFIDPFLQQKQFLLREVSANYITNILAVIQLFSRTGVA
jgi:hypothetical protein